MKKANYETELYFSREDNKLSERMQQDIAEVLEQNRPVGIIAGYYEEGLPIAYIDKNALVILGYTQEEFEKETDLKYTSLIPTEYQIYFLQGAFKQVNTRRKYLLYGKDKEEIWVKEWKKDTVDETGKEMWIISLKSITTAHRRELELLNYKADVQKTLEVAQTGLWRIECDAKQRGLNFFADYSTDAMLGIYSVVSEQERFEFFKSHVFKEDMDLFEQFEENIMKNGRAEVTTRYNHPFKGESYIRFGGFLMENTEAHCVYRGYIQDITATSLFQNEQKKRIQDLLVEARSANKAKTEFLSRMSHDIRTPINGILGMLDISEQYLEEPEKLAECYGKIRTSANYLMSLISDVLNMSKLDAGKMEFAHEAFDLRDVLTSCLEIVRPMAVEKGIKIILPEEGSISHPYVLGSPLHIRQIIINIAQNAIKYNRPKGKVTTEIREIECTDYMVVYEISIEDTGLGISEDLQKHMFDAFTQGGSSARSHYEGAGLGLSIAKKLTEALDGTIAVSSQEGVGSIFRITLPFEIDRRTDEERLISKKQIVKPSFKGKKVLIVEDNELNMEITEFMMRDLDFEVDKAENGQVGVEMFRKSAEGEYDLVLMDIMMPVLDGHQATRKIRRMRRADAKTVPIVAMTANAFLEDRKKALAAGMNEHIAKPVEKDRLLSVLKKYVTR